MSVQFDLRVTTGQSGAAIQGVTNDLTKAAVATDGVASKFAKLGTMAFHANNLRSAISGITNTLNESVAPGIAFNTSLTDMQAITGVNNDQLDTLSKNARQVALDFGGTAAGAAEVSKLFLSQLNPELAKTPVALDRMTRYAAVLSKQLGGDMPAAAEILSTALNQYGVSTSDATEASRVMADMMNIMTAAAKEGSAELPQIKGALQQAGMMAKTAGVPFNELNAAIQVLDKSGKKGAEGGVALRNVMARISEGEFMPQKTLQMLSAAGVHVASLTDRSLSLADRLALLKPIVGDTAYMTQMFGAENVSAGIALVQNTGNIQALTQKITGTNAAVEMAQTVMGSYAEGAARTKSKFEDLGISIFGSASSFVPFLNYGEKTLTILMMLGGAVEGFSILSKANMIQSAIAGVSALGTWIASTITATAAQWGLNVAITANPIGIAVVAIVAAIAAIALLITYWDDIKTAIVSFGLWIWNHHPFKWFLDLVEVVFPGFKKSMGDLWDWVENKIEALFSWISGIWKNIKGIFGDTQSLADSLSSPTMNAQQFGATVTPGGLPVLPNNIPVIHPGSNVGFPKAAIRPTGKGENGKQADSNKTIASTTASNITSGGARPTTVNIVIHKIQDQTIIQAATPEMASQQMADRILQILTEQLEGANLMLGN